MAITGTPDQIIVWKILKIKLNGQAKPLKS